MIDFSQFDSLIAMTMYFNNEATCKQAIIETRWGVGEHQDVVCPYCGKHHCTTRKIDEAVYRWNTRKMDESQRFAHMFSMSVGLIVTWSELKLCKAG